MFVGKDDDDDDDDDTNNDDNCCCNAETIYKATNRATSPPPCPSKTPKTCVT